MGTHPVKARDVHIGDNKDKVLFILRTSKTHWSDEKLQTIKIMSSKLNPLSQAKNSEFCPYRLLRHYLAV